MSITSKLLFVNIESLSKVLAEVHSYVLDAETNYVRITVANKSTDNITDVFDLDVARSLTPQKKFFPDLRRSIVSSITTAFESEDDTLVKLEMYNR
jgi:hypothetical protein